MGCMIILGLIAFVFIVLHLIQIGISGVLTHWLIYAAGILLFVTALQIGKHWAMREIDRETEPK